MTNSAVTTIDDCQMVTSTSSTSSAGFTPQVVSSIAMISTSLLPPPSALISSNAYQNQGYHNGGRTGADPIGFSSNGFISKEKLMGILDEVLTLIDDSEDLFAGTLSMQS